MNTNHGCFPIEVRGVTDGRHRIRIMTGQVARDGDVVEPMGMQLDNYLLNPVVMWAHDYQGSTPSGGLPIGRTLSLERTPGGIDAEFEFLPDDPFASRVQNAWERGFLRTASIGWESLEATPLPGGFGLRHKRTDLLEWSLVPVPADPGASRELFLAGMRSLGYGDLLGERGATRRKERRETPLEHPPLSRLVGELQDSWDYVKARIATEGIVSPRLRASLNSVLSDMAATLPVIEPPIKTRDNGDDTADANKLEVCLHTARRLLELAEMPKSMDL